MEVIFVDQKGHDFSNVEVSKHYEKRIKTASDWKINEEALLTRNEINALVILHKSDWTKLQQVKLETTIKQLLSKKALVILFSGGDYNFISNSLEAEYPKGGRWDCIPESKLDFSINWERIKEQESSAIEKIEDIYLSLEYIDELIAMDVLAQGYLAVWMPETIFANHHNNNYYAKKINKNKFPFFSSQNSQNLFIQEPNRDDKSFWFDPLADSQHLSYVEVSKGSNKWAEAGQIKRAWVLVINKGCEKGKYLSSEDMLNIFYYAHKEFKSLSLDNHSIQAMEDARSELNHTMVMNNFIQKLTGGNLDSKRPERVIFITDVWNGDDTTGNLAARRTSVRQALENWPSVRTALKDFFYNTPMTYGYEGTSHFEEVRRKFFEGDKSNKSIIDKFVNEFYDIGHGDIIERERRLDEFLVAVDAIHIELSKMRLGVPGDGFNKYFKKIEK